MDFKLGELFCGPGGIGYSAVNTRVKSTSGEEYSISHGWANDYDKDTCDTYLYNVGKNHSGSVFCEDIRKIDFRDSKFTAIDALAFGFPCNDFSLVGEQKGMDGVYGPLYKYCTKALKTFEPQWFLAENVGGLRNSNDGFAFKKILGEFKNAGYRLVPHLYKFEEYGIPQARHRIVIIGVRNDINCEFKVPSPAPYGLVDNSARTAIEVPPIPGDAKNNEKTKHASQVIERLKHIKPGQNAFNAKLPENLKLNVKGATISQIYKRLHPEKPAYTITGSGGGGTHVYHWSENRALTNRERARLQTFPDTFEFKGPKESVRKQIGMAVPPTGSKLIIEALLNCYAGIEYPNIEQNIQIDDLKNDYRKVV